MKNYIEVTVTYGDKLLLDVQFISEVRRVLDNFERTEIILSNGNTYMVDCKYEDLKCRLIDNGRSMTNNFVKL